LHGCQSCPGDSDPNRISGGSLALSVMWYVLTVSQVWAL
jgi:hypothetical protein